MTSFSRRLLGIAAAFGLIALAACNLENLQAPGLAPEKDQAARNVFKAMQKGDLAGIPLGPEMSTPEARAAMPVIFARIPKGQPTKVRLLNWKTNWSALTGDRTENMETNHEYTFGTTVLLVETVMQRDIPASGQPGPWKLRGFHFKPAPPAGGAAPATKADPAAAAPAPATPAPAAQTGVNDFVEQPSDYDPPAARPARTAPPARAQRPARAAQPSADAEITLSKTPAPEGEISKSTSN